MSNKRELLDDLASNESRYLKSLKSIINAYMTPLTTSGLLTSVELYDIFRTLEDIRNVHVKLNDVIQAASEDVNWVAVCNEFVVAKAALLELYVPYFQGHEKALAVLRAARARTEVGRFIDDILATDERVKGMSLEDCLLIPIRHIEDYKKFTSSLLSVTAQSDRAYIALNSNADLFDEILKYGSSILKDSAASSSSSSSANNTISGAVSTALASSGISTVDSNTSIYATALLPSLANVNKPTPSVTSSSKTSPEELLAAVLPIPASSLQSELSTNNVTAEAVLAAQAEADAAVRRLEQLEHEVALKENDLALAQREVVRLVSENREKGESGNPNLNPTGVAALDEALKYLTDQEADLIARMRRSETRDVFEAFLQRRKELEAEEAALAEKLGEHEEALAQVRARLANPPASLLPSDPAKASLYIAWKRALLERENLLQQARRRKHGLLRDLRARHETQLVLLEMERAAAVDNLKSAVEQEKKVVEGYKRDLEALDASIESAREAMKTFRQEFEQLRVSLLVERMARSTQVSNLSERRQRLAREAESFRGAIAAARARVAAEESAEWETRLAAEREAGERRVNEERAAIEARVEKVRNALAERYEAGFAPLLRQAEARHIAELQKVVDLQKELSEKEAELTTLQSGLFNSSPSSLNPLISGSSLGETSSSDSLVATTANIPQWKLKEFEDLKSAVAALWEQLDVPAEEAAAFLSEADLLAPFSETVLQMYTEMYIRLVGSEGISSTGLSAIDGEDDSRLAPQLSQPPSGNALKTQNLSGSLSQNINTPQRSTNHVVPVSAVAASGSRRSTSPRQAAPKGRISYNSSEDPSDYYLRKLANTSLPPSLGGSGHISRH